MVVEISAPTPCFFCSSETPVAQGTLRTWVWACSCRQLSNGNKLHRPAHCGNCCLLLMENFLAQDLKTFHKCRWQCPRFTTGKAPKKHPEEAGNQPGSALSIFCTLPLALMLLLKRKKYLVCIVASWKMLVHCLDFVKQCLLRSLWFL